MPTLSRRIKRETFLFYTLFMVVCSGVGWLFFREVIPQWTFSTFWLIPAYFYALGIATGLSFSFCEVMLPGRTHHYYLAQKGAKFMLSIAVLLLASYMESLHPKVFILTFLVFYFLTTGFELWFFCRIELIKKMIERDNKHYRRRRRRIVKK